MAVVEAEAHRRAHGRVHARRRAAQVHDGQPHAVPLRVGRARLGLHQRAQNLVGLDKAAAAHGHGLVVVARLDQLGHLLRLAHILHERRVHDLVVADAEELRFVVGRGCD